MSNYDQMTKDELGSLYWDAYKEVHGVRPRWVNHDDVTAEWYKAALDLLAEEAEAQLEDEQHWNRIQSEREAYERRMLDLPEMTKAEQLAENV